jgi:hypothetical protein
MAWLKALVIGMGVLIVAGVGVIAVTLVHRMGGATSSPPAAPVSAPLSASTAPGNGRIELPPGARIAETHLDGRNLVLRLTLPDGGTRIVIYDLNGKPVASLDVVESR